MTMMTEDYTIFKTHAHNREKNEGNIQKIIRSVKFKNLLHLRPILVNKNMEVIDGQHRLEVASRLGLAIYYEVQGNLTPSDIRILNDNQLTWKREDYLKFYVTEGIDDYIRLKNFMDKQKLNLVPALTALGLMGAKAHSKDFKEGGFKYPSLADECDAIEILHKSRLVVEYLLHRTIEMKAFLNGPKFQRCLFLFFSVKGVDSELFMSKLSHKMDLVRPASRQVDLLSILQSIYNWKNSKPVFLQDLV